MSTEKQYVCVDVETTGLDHNTEEIVEVYARRFKEDGALGKEFYQRCKPRNNYIPAQATAIHGITFEMVKDCPNYLMDGVQAALVNFIGERKVIGHNLIGFDIKFLKIKPLETEDTLLICRDRFGVGHNSLRKACKRAGIPFDPSKAHAASYDVEKTIQLYLNLKKFPSSNVQQNLFTPPPDPQVPMTFGPEPTPIPISVGTKTAEIKDIYTQPYSFSRINLFHQCPFKWYKRYIEKIHEPDQDPLVIGSICHKIAQNTATWCYRESFANKFSLYAAMINFKTSIELGKDSQAYYDIADPTYKQIGYFLFENPKSIEKHTGFKGLSHLISDMDVKIGEAEYEKVSMPDLDTYNKIMNETIRNYRVMDPDIIIDVQMIMMRFYKSKDFSNKFGKIALVEKQLSFDKDWNYISDWRSDSIFFRGIIDVIEYYPEYILITDYKTSRSTLSVEQLKEDMQLKIYLLLLYKFLPPGSIKRVIVSIEYLRFGTTVEYEVENIEQMAQEACQWVNDSIMDIENELAKDREKSFKPKRNKWCNSCHLGDGNICPLFSRKHINNIDDIESFEVKTKEDCVTAWKRVETNKREIKNLTSKCKNFVQTSEQTIVVDETAKLDNYEKQVREYDVEYLIPFLLKKGLKMTDIIYYLNISPTNVEKLINKNKLEISEPEYNQISHLKIRHEFDAVTDDEAKANEYMNA